MKQKILLFFIFTCVLFGQLTAQVSTNTIRYQVTYDLVSKLYTIWVVPDYSTPNAFNADTVERGPTAQVTLRVPREFVISEVTSIKGEWDKNPIKLGPNEPNQSFFNSLNNAFRYYTIGKSASETVYGRFTKDKAVALFQFKGNGCFGAISVLDETDEFVKLAEKYALNVRPSFYSRSGQRNFVNAIPLEQFINPVDPPAYCCGSGVSMPIPITINTNQSNFCPEATVTISLKGMKGISNQGIRFRLTTTEPLTEEEAYGTTGTVLGVVANNALTSNKADASLSGVILPKTAGKYFVVATLDGATGACRPFTSTRFSIVNSGTAALSADKTGAICLGESVQFTAQPAGQPKYEWFKDGQSVATTTTNSYKATSAGGYKVVATNETGCLLGTSNTVSFTTIVVNKPTIKQSGERLISSSKTGNQWFSNNSPIQGANDTVYIATKQGVYTLQVTLGSCKSEFSDPVLLAITSVENPQKTTINGLFPNPTSGVFYVQVLDNHPYTVVCYDLMGKKIKLPAEPLTDKIKADASQLPRGTYLIRLESDTKVEGSWVLKKE